MQGPLFEDGSFEFVPIPDETNSDGHTYGNTAGRNNKKLVDYFPQSRRARMADQAIHFDPEFETFTYGDPSTVKSGLRRLERGDLLIFYCGLEGWDFNSEAGLYLMGYFEVLTAGRAGEYGPDELKALFGQNFHVRHRHIYERQKEKLVLVKGTGNSRLLETAVLISAYGQNRLGKPIKVLSPEMQSIFGDFGGKISIQRSPPRWIDPDHVQKAANFVRSLD